jgi:hypothetical protein
MGNRILACAEEDDGLTGRRKPTAYRLREELDKPGVHPEFLQPEELDYAGNAEVN